MQTDSFQNFSDLTLKATFIIFFGKELITNLIECQHQRRVIFLVKRRNRQRTILKDKTAAKSSKQDLSSDFWKTLFLTISNISFLRFDFLANSYKH